MAKKEKIARACKERMVDEITSRFKKHRSFVITGYMGSTVSDLEALRKSLKKSSSSYFVVKNSILRIIFESLKLKDEAAKIESGMGISLSGDDIISTCKTLVTFAKDHAKFKIKGAYIDGKTVAAERVNQLASLPSKEILLAQVVGGIKSPITGFVIVLGGVLRKFVYCVDAIKTKRQSAPAQSTAEAP